MPLGTHLQTGAIKPPPSVRIILGDCMKAMRGMPDKAYDLAIVDPPYGIGADRHHLWKTGGKACASKTNYGASIWDSAPPTLDYFTELFRVSKNQIIWGGNYFINFIRLPSPCWLVWDKLTGDNPFADVELAYTSFRSIAKIFTYRWQGMLQENMKHKERRIHPTQKPVALYKWLLNNYAKPGDTILDTHGGSCSLAIACDVLGFDCTIYEIDEDYYRAAVERFERHRRQAPLPFEAAMPKLETENLF